MVRTPLLSLTARLTALVGVLAGAVAAQAQTFTWSSGWSTPSPVNATSTTGGSPLTNFQVLLSGSAVVTTDTAPTFITIATERSQINNGDTNAGTFNAPVNLNLTLAGITQNLALNLTGVLNGAGAGSSSLQIDGFPASLIYNTAGGTYTVDTFQATAIGTPNAPLPGAISARVTFQAASTGTAPEPGTLALVTLGCGGLILARRRKR